MWLSCSFLIKVSHNAQMMCSGTEPVQVELCGLRIILPLQYLSGFRLQNVQTCLFSSTSLLHICLSCCIWLLLHGHIFPAMTISQYGTKVQLIASFPNLKPCCND